GPKAPALDSQATTGMASAVSSTSRRIAGSRCGGADADAARWPPEAMRGLRSGLAESAARVRGRARRWRDVDVLAGEDRIAVRWRPLTVVAQRRRIRPALVPLPRSVGE